MHWITLAQATQPIIVQQGFQIDEKKIILWGLIGTALVVGFFKLVDLIIERIGNTRKLLIEQGLMKAKIADAAVKAESAEMKAQAVAQNVAVLNQVTDQKSTVVAVPPHMAETTQRIGTGSGGITPQPQSE